MNKEPQNNSMISHYKILSKIGKGGMGEVYLAEDTKLDRQVALKILPVEFAEDKDRMSRFVREAKSASALNHPNIITIYEINKFENIHYIATEFIDGKTLNEYAKDNPLNYNSALDIAIQVASALDEAHQAGIVHRDIKPDNIMVRDNGLVKILDFGIAKLSEASPANVSSEDATAIKPQTATMPGTIIGTANYMSPEQAKGKVVDARSDIFSFGVVLYEMLAGKLPFEGETAIEMIGAILKDEPKPIDADVPNEISAIINKCLLKDRNERYQTIKDVLNDLQDTKQNLELQNLMERTISPEKEEPKTQILQATTVDDVHQTTTNQAISSNANTKYFAVGLLTLLLAVGGYFGYTYFSSTNQIESIAVMPFVNESGNEDVEYLSDGMTETLINSLTEIPNLSVKARSSVFYYKGKNVSPKQIGEELNVEAVLLGRVTQRGDDIKLNLELVDTKTLDNLWSANYDRKTSDLVTLQSEIAKDVSTKIKSKLSGAEETKVTKSATVNPEAYKAYLKGRYYWNRRTTENLKKAIEQFKLAIDLDNKYALAYVGLADCYAVLSYYAGTPTSETLPQSKAYAMRAIKLDDSLAEPHATLGLVNDQLWQWTEAEREFKRAIELNPNYATAYHWYFISLSGRGRFDEAAEMIKWANELDPLSSIIAGNLSQMYQGQNNYQASIETSLKTIELNPNFSDAYRVLGLSYLKQGRENEGIANLEKAAELSKRASISLADLGYAYGVTGNRAKAIAIAKELEEMYQKKQSVGRSVAAVYAGLGDKDKTFEWLEKDFQSRNGEFGLIRWQIPFESLRDEPRFKDLVKRMKLPE